MKFFWHSPDAYSMQAETELEKEKLVPFVENRGNAYVIEFYQNRDTPLAEPRFTENPPPGAVIARVTLIPRMIRK